MKVRVGEKVLLLRFFVCAAGAQAQRYRTNRILSVCPLGATIFPCSRPRAVTGPSPCFWRLGCLGLAAAEAQVADHGHHRPADRLRQRGQAVTFLANTADRKPVRLGGPGTKGRSCHTSRPRDGCLALMHTNATWGRGSAARATAIPNLISHTLAHRFRDLICVTPAADGM